MKQTAPFLLSVLLLLPLAADPVMAQPPPVAPNALWIAGGGAAGETTQIAISSHWGGFDNYAIVWSAALHPTPQSPQLAPPYHVVGAGVLSTSRVAVHRVTLPADPRLIGAVVHLQGATAYQSNAVLTPVLTWVVAPATGRRFVMTSPSQPLAAVPGDGHARATLADGTVLIAGGRDLSLPGLRYRGLAYVFDPARTVVRTLGVMKTGRGGHVMRRLGNGRVLIVGGDQNDQTPVAELYSPTTGAFTTLSVPGFLQDPTATVIREPGTGREFVLLAGGRSSRNGAPTPAAYLYDVSAGRFTKLPGMAHARAEAAAVPLAAGTVLVTGGRDANQTVRADAELFVLATRRFYPWGRMTRARHGHGIVALDPYHALIVSGRDGTGRAGVDTELFDGRRAAATRLPHRLHLGRYRFTPLRLADGSVLVAGGREDARSDPGRTPELIGAAGVTPLRPIVAPRAGIAVQPLLSGGVMAYDGTSIHLLK